jgi:hypothetical protein
MFTLSIGFYPYLASHSIYLLQRAACLAASEGACQQNLRGNFASIFILLIISEDDEPDTQKSLAFALELG